MTSSSRAMLIGSHLGFKRDVIIKVGADWIKLQSDNEVIGRLQGLGYTWQYVIATDVPQQVRSREFTREI